MILCVKSLSQPGSDNNGIISTGFWQARNNFRCSSPSLDSLFGRPLRLGIASFQVIPSESRRSKDLFNGARRAAEHSDHCDRPKRSKHGALLREHVPWLLLI